MLPAVALCLIFLPISIRMLPRALAAGLSRSSFPGFEWTWLLPAAVAIAITWMEARNLRTAALATVAIAITVGITVLKGTALPEVDRAYSARPLWREIAARRSQVCVESMHRSWRYGLNYYSKVPLPDCDQVPEPLRISQEPGRPPVVKAR